MSATGRHTKLLGDVNVRRGFKTRAGGAVIELAEGDCALRLSSSPGGWQVRVRPTTGAPAALESSASSAGALARFEVQAPSDDPRRVLRVHVPGRSARLREQAMLFALEDQLAGDVEDVERIGFYEVPTPSRPRRSSLGVAMSGPSVEASSARRNGADYWVTLLPAGPMDRPFHPSATDAGGVAPASQQTWRDGGVDGGAPVIATAPNEGHDDWRQRLPASVLLLHADDGWIRVCRTGQGGGVANDGRDMSSISGAWVDWPGDAPVFVPEALLELFVTTLLDRLKLAPAPSPPSAAGGNASGPSGDGGVVHDRPLGVAWIEARALAAGAYRAGPDAVDATAERLWSAFQTRGLEVWTAVSDGEGTPRTDDWALSRTALAQLAQGVASDAAPGVDGAVMGHDANCNVIRIADKGVAGRAALLALAAGVAPPSSRGFEWRRVAHRASPPSDAFTRRAEDGSGAATASGPPAFEPLPLAWRALTPATELGRAGPVWGNVRVWRPAAALVVGALIAGGAGAWLEIRALERELRAAEAALEERFAALLPGEPMIDPVRQVDGWLASRGGAAGPPEADFTTRYVSLVRTLDAAVMGNAPQGRVRIEALRIDGERIELELTAPNLTAIEDLRRRFDDARLLSNTQIEGGGVQAVLRVDALGGIDSVSSGVFSGMSVARTEHVRDPASYRVPLVPRRSTSQDGAS